MLNASCYWYTYDDASTLSCVERTPGQRRWTALVPSYYSCRIRATCHLFSAIWWRSRWSSLRLFRMSWNNGGTCKYYRNHFSLFLFITFYWLFLYLPVTETVLFFFPLIWAHETQQVLNSCKVIEAVVAWILHVQHVDILLLVIDEPQRNDLSVFSFVYIILIDIAFKCSNLEMSFNIIENSISTKFNTVI